MLKALVIKELRESAGIAALAAIALVYAFCDLTATRVLPWQAREPAAFPFVTDSLSFYLSFFMGGLAIALGLKQTAWEGSQYTFLFLLHRPVNRWRPFATKLAVGTCWVLIAAAILILVYAWWAATPGHVAAPFEWSMTVGAWQIWMVLPIVYLGAFLSGVRPARWFGTRLVPLAGSMFLAAMACIMPWWWLTLIVVIVSASLFLTSIFYYAQVRDY